MPIGVKVTLRRENMYEFVDKLFNVAFPRVRDFRGINPNSFDLAEEITQQVSRNSLFSLRSSMIRLTKSGGMDINFITTAKTDEEAKELLSLLGAPFAK